MILNSSVAGASLPTFSGVVVTAEKSSLLDLASSPVISRPSLLPSPPNRVQGEIIHKDFNPFFQWFNGSLKPISDSKTFFEKTSGWLLNVSKTIWASTPILQIFGLVSKRADMFARAIYGTCWSIAYTALRPFKADAELLSEENAPNLIPDQIKTLDKLNEHFRFGAGSLVSMIYGGGAFGMLWNAFTGNEEGFETAKNIYSNGMFDQNMIFASMNAKTCLTRKYNPNQLGEIDKQTNNIKAKAELIDTVLFLPTVVTRALDTFKLFGGVLGETVEKIVNSFGYFSYGTWAGRFGDVKTLEAEEIINKTENPNKLANALNQTQLQSSKVFKTVLPGLSFISAGLEMFGMGEWAKKVFTLEGTLERLLPTIPAWCLRYPVLSRFVK